MRKLLALCLLALTMAACASVVGPVLGKKNLCDPPIDSYDCY